MPSSPQHLGVSAQTTGITGQYKLLYIFLSADEQETEIERLQRRCKSYERELELKRDEESLF